MEAFAALYAQLDGTTSTNAKRAAMAAHFQAVPAEDAAWAVYFLAGGKPGQLVPTRILRQFARQASELPEWLFDESYQAVGDLAETIALLIGPAVIGATAPIGLARWMEERLHPLAGLSADEAINRLSEVVPGLGSTARFVCFKLITGAFRVGVSKLLVTRALADVAGLDAKRIAERLLGYTDRRHRPDAEAFRRLITPDLEASTELDRGAQPYPFFLAHPLSGDADGFAARIGPPSEWLIEWKWDGVRAQVVHRQGLVAIWSRGEELVTDRFPELVAMALGLPDGTVLDGEIVVRKAGRVQPFALLQQRLGRKNLTLALLEKLPVCLFAFDLLEGQSHDLRGLAQSARRLALERLVSAVHAARPSLAANLQISPKLTGIDWSALERQRRSARSLGVEGMMLKSVQSRYGVGRTRSDGVWWKWKVDPFSVDAVLIYAQRGHGRRAGLYSDYTFAVWSERPGPDQERRLVPFAKAYSGLTDREMAEVDAIVRRTTIESFGPVRRVEPRLVFELGFEGLALSKRHKSGIAVRFPRMLRWRRDKPIEEADSLATLAELLPEISSA